MSVKRGPLISESERRDTKASSVGDGLDFHASPPEAANVLLSAERRRLRMFDAIAEPACGDGALVLPFRRAGFGVVASDIVRRGCPQSNAADFFALRGSGATRLMAHVTNPPFNRAVEWIWHACARHDYVALLLRARFLNGKHARDFARPQTDGSFVKRRGRNVPLWAATRIPLARIVLTDGRLPMMHRGDYDGPKTESSSIDFNWYVWDADHRGPPDVIFPKSWQRRAA